jgi:hypothetical protein
LIRFCNAYPVPVSTKQMIYLAKQIYCVSSCQSRRYMRRRVKVSNSHKYQLYRLKKDCRLLVQREMAAAALERFARNLISRQNCYTNNI